MNPILEKMYKERVIYCHVLEVNNVHELERVIENSTEQLIKDFTIEDVTEFITTLGIYYLGDNEDEERRVFNFDVENKIKEMIL